MARRLTTGVETDLGASEAGLVMSNGRQTHSVGAAIHSQETGRTADGEKRPSDTCTSRSDEHLPRQAPRGIGWSSSAGNVIKMDRKKGGVKSPRIARAVEGLSTADKTRMTEQIGRQLRGMYDGLLNQPVPDRFMELVSKLERGDQDVDREQ